MKVDVELENAYGPNVFTIDGVEHTMDRKPGHIKIWTNKDGENTFHIVDLPIAAIAQIFPSVLKR